jgi:hypothetical protein
MLRVATLRTRPPARGVRWAQGGAASGGPVGPPHADELDALPWADADDELTDLPSPAGTVAAVSSAARVAKRSAEAATAAAASAEELSLERIAHLLAQPAKGAPSRAGQAAGRRRSEAVEALEAASLSEIATLVQAVAEERADGVGAREPRSGATRAAQFALFDPRVRTPPWAQVRARACAGRSEASGRRGLAV